MEGVVLVCAIIHSECVGVFYLYVLALRSGILPIFIGSAPQAAAFFACYNSVKKLSNSPSDPYTHMIGSTCGELMACIFRVPTENVKQKMQVGLHTTMRGTYRSMLATDGFMGFFVGFGATALRDVPFSFIQFPLWEFFKKTWSKYLGKRRKIYSYESALCGSAAGAVAAFLTTPTDVVKTRLMLGHDIKGVRYVGTINTMARIAREEGVRALFAGVVSRVIWISIGGITFFGGYELVLEALEGEMHIY
eukprot:246144_1